MDNQKAPHRWCHYDGQQVLYCFEIASDATADDLRYVLDIISLMNRQLERRITVMEEDAVVQEVCERQNVN